MGVLKSSKEHERSDDSGVGEGGFVGNGDDVGLINWVEVG
jgi:hypothetical protein